MCGTIVNRGTRTQPSLWAEPKGRRRGSHKANPLSILGPLHCISYLQLYHQLPQSLLLREIHIFFSSFCGSDIPAQLSWVSAQDLIRLQSSVSQRSAFSTERHWLLGSCRLLVEFISQQLQNWRIQVLLSSSSLRKHPVSRGCPPFLARWVSTTWLLISLAPKRVLALVC